MQSEKTEGCLVKSIRSERNIRQVELAALSGISPTKIGHIERGVTRCNQATAAKIAAALGVKPEKAFPNFESLRRW